jgi:tetratricopeptide (TPR) repeat protein/mono/diheme cytochrome c family protein
MWNRLATAAVNLATRSAVLWLIFARAAAAQAPVTFVKDIAPVLFRECASCHRPDGSAPFSVLTFADVRPRAKAIAEAVQRRTMPPWKPEPGHGDFVGARRLRGEEIDTIVRWAEDGAPLGDPAALPQPPERNDRWQLGPPDLVLTMPEAYRLSPGGPDRLRNFVIPIPISARRYVRAWEFHTTNPRVVHHATFLIDPTPASRRLDLNDPEPGYEGLVSLSAKNPDGYFLGWTPGQSPSAAPEQMAWTLDVNSDLVMMLHLRPTDHWETVDASIGLYFSNTPPTRMPAMIRLNRQDIAIPAGEPHYVVADSYVLPVDVEAYSVQPHAHNLAKEVKGWATLPDGTTKWLIDIRRWDFHWQDSYHYVAPVPLPAGTRVSMEFTYDNSESNLANPARPPKRVIFGQRTSDEMGDLWLQVVPRDSRDLAVLNQSLRTKLLPQNISGYQMMLQADPDNASLHDDLAILLSQAGDLPNAANQFAESLRLRPDAPSHYNLGNALLGLGRWAEASAQFEQALQLEAQYALAHHGLALSLANRGARDDAIRHFREAIRLKPTLEEAHYNLGVLLGARHEPVAAIASFRSALELRRDWPAAQAQLAWILATSPDAAVHDPKEAVSLAEHSVALTSHRDAWALDVLAASLASDGQFDRAVVAAESALNLLKEGSDAETLQAVGRRLEMYRNRIVYVDSQ